jgi:serine/threonine-protein kinase ULK/ATG1
MEYCQLGDLSYFIKRRDVLSRNNYTADMVKKYPNPPPGGLHEVVVRHFLQQLASALEFLRNKNLIHRDVKPQNLLLIPSPQYYSKARPDAIPYAQLDKSLIPVAGIESLPMLKLADFGFARSLPSTSLAETLCGSPLYMAPEILRYEKYDAKADLWSVGTVTYEMMTGRPPFRASNHVELLRKIEQGEDKIRFSGDVVISDAMKKLIRGLLKRNPVERMSFSEFFEHPVMTEMIPGLVDEDLPKKQTAESQNILANETIARQSTPPQPLARDSRTQRDEQPRRPSTAQTRSTRSEVPTSNPQAEFYARSPQAPRRGASLEPEAEDIFVEASERPLQDRRPVLPRGATAPLTRSPINENAHRVAVAALHRKSSRDSPPPTSAGRDMKQLRHASDQRTDNLRQAREAQERAAQDVAFERDYVVVEKRAVEVNALADELAASPKIHGGNNTLNRGDLIRRATTQNTPQSGMKGASAPSSRALQIVSGQRPEHGRQPSWERRQRSATSTSSAISKAINLASGRLFSFGMSPPLSLGRGPSPPSYNPFPAYPTTTGSLLMIGDSAKTSAPIDEDTKAVHAIEESATRSDVVYGFAEVKYKQLIPLAPSMEHGLGLQAAGVPEKDDLGVGTEDDAGLTPDAIVVLSEEALVLYVKALSLLDRSMDIAGAWWARKSRGEVVEEPASPKTQTTPAHNAAVGNRVNNVVQWVRSRFNEVLEKAEYVRLKLIEAQKRLPLDHPSHPNNHPTSSHSVMGSSAENVVISPGVSAEKLMYFRAVDMSRGAAVNELLNEDLAGCEIAYVTAIRMLEAVLVEDDDELSSNKVVKLEAESSGEKEEERFNLLNPEDREAVLKSMYTL